MGDGGRSTRLSAGIVVVRRSGDASRYLLLRAYRYWDFPKGEVEPGEDPLQSAIREVEEETGLANLRFRWGKGYTVTEPYSHGKVARYYLAESSQGEVELAVNPELGRPEHHEFRWVSEREAGGLLNERVRRVLDWAVARIAGD